MKRRSRTRAGMWQILGLHEDKTSRGRRSCHAFDWGRGLTVVARFEARQHTVRQMFYCGVRALQFSTHLGAETLNDAFLLEGI